MMMQKRNGGDDYWNQRLDRGFLMESPPHSKLFDDNSSDLNCLMKPLSAVSSGGGGASSALSVGDGCLGCIEHTVTKFDTLAGVAIKYGVEVADIKKMNGLTTDLQMFSRKTLCIPLPGRHPPSPIMTNGYDIQGPRKHEITPPNRRCSDLFDSINSLKLSSSSPQTVSPSMEALRDYYGLKPTNQNDTHETFGSSIHQKAGSFSLEHGPKQPPASHPPLGLHRKWKSLANGLSEKGETTNGNGLIANGNKPDSNTWYYRLTRRQTYSPETMLKPDTTNATTAFSAAAGKGLALRPKAASRTASEADSLQHFPSPIKLGDSHSPVSDSFGAVKKSSSSPSFYDSYNTVNSNGNSNSNGNNCTSSLSLWSTSMLNLTVDLQALSTAAITRPIFDGLPKPMSGRKNKAAID